MICLSTQLLPISIETRFRPIEDRFQFHARRRLNSKSRGVSVVCWGIVGLKKSSVSMAAEEAGGLPAVMLTSGASGRVNALFSLRVLKSLLMLINAFLMLLLLPFRGKRSSVSTTAISCEKIKDEKQDGGSSSGSGSSQSHRKAPVVRVPANVPWKSSATAVVAVEQDAAARRALAIRRVMEGKDDKSVREYSLFVTSRRETMFTQSWTPVSKKIRGLVVVLHGLNEHGGRYNGFANELNANGYKVYAMDWIGHGGSDGLHAYVPSLDEAVMDTKSFIGKVLDENPGLPCFCFGHSTGAAIILKALLDPKVETWIAGAVFTSPAVGVPPPTHPLVLALAPVFSVLFPRRQLRAANKQGAVVSRDPKALMAKYSDPLVYTGSIRIRTGYEILRISTFLQQNLGRLTAPFLVLHGAADTITDPNASEKLYEEAASTDKTMKLYEGLLHDLLFEPEHEMIVEDIVDWLNRRI